ncbi:glycosyltransferase family 39 protein [Chamaesiphon sp. VAR_69_metabat_338]|uniref:glycosyltransferase family 39 protein n=1 Tax=Chamaesiphon sp. VAR_69_metabat_338 TaxID=2964704 RepID=UPI00286E75BB|nr:glycosyltransferase family 39 protein [Chamaesiphon sp. VAR_69_metabat_338]
MDDFTKRWAIGLLVILLTIGIFFRIINLGQKPVWGGEAQTLSMISGYSDGEVIDKISTPALTNKIVSVESFLKYRFPNDDNNLRRIIHKLYTENHPPLYFVLAHAWVKLFGSSVTTLRSLAAVLSWLAVPCIYWLCLELFGIPVIGLMASASLSVSPIQVIYAHEAGSFSLLSLIVLLSSAALLWALRTQQKLAWAIYGISLGLGLYCQYYFVFTLFGQIAYVLSIEPLRTRKLANFSLVVLIASLSFLPWTITVFNHLASFQDLTSLKEQNHLTLLGTIAFWAENISLSFVDLVDPKASEYGGFGKFGFYFFTPLILSLVGYSIYLLRAKTPKQVYLCIFFSIGSTAVPLIIFDLFAGQNQEIWPENLCPIFPFFQICVAYLLSTKGLLLDSVDRSWYRKYWLPIAAILITEGVVFCGIYLQADTWWNKYGGEDILSFTQIVRQAPDLPILVNRQHPESLVIYNLQPQVKLVFVDAPQLNHLNVTEFATLDTIFFLNPDLEMQAELKRQHYQLRLLAQYPNLDRVYDGLTPPQLWKLRKFTSIPMDDLNLK